MASLLSSLVHRGSAVAAALGAARLVRPLVDPAGALAPADLEARAEGPHSPPRNAAARGAPARVLPHEHVAVALHVVLVGGGDAVDGVVAHRVLRAQAIGLLVVGGPVEVHGRDGAALRSLPHAPRNAALTQLEAVIHDEANGPWFPRSCLIKREPRALVREPRDRGGYHD